MIAVKMAVRQYAARMALAFGDRLVLLMVSTLRGLVVGRCMICFCVSIEWRTERRTSNHEAESKCPMSVILGKRIVYSLPSFSSA